MQRLKNRIQKVLQWKNIKVLLLADTLIGLVLASFSYRPDPVEWLTASLVKMLFAHFIGTSIYVLSILLSCRIRNRLLNGLFSAGVFMIGGWFGYILSWLVLYPFGIRLTYGSLPDFILVHSLIFLLLATAVQAVFMLRSRLLETVNKLTEKEIDEQRLRRLKTEAELDALRAKINPHFLFNTLNSIASLIPVDPDKAEQMVQKLSNLFRHTLEIRHGDTLKLSEELYIVREYLEIEKIRLGQRLHFQIHTAPAAEDIKIPGFIIQPLVENAVKHAISPSPNGGTIKIVCSLSEACCEIRISDSGNGFVSRESAAGFGLSSVRERLDLIYGDQYDFTITCRDGTQIRLQLPINRNNEDAGTIPHNPHRR